MANILAIGIATLDIINTVESYPKEDSEVRALSQHQSRGGNATNTLTVLSQLGHRCYWGGVLIDEPDSQIIKHNLVQYMVDYSLCRIVTTGKMPTSYISLNQQTGSRSIVHYRDCPEFSFDDFCAIDLSQFDWVHFEGRHIDDLYLMLQHLKRHHPELRCSLEVEKPRPNIELLFEYPSVLMFSQQYAQHLGFDDPVELLTSLPDDITASCTWGKQGAWMISPDRNILHSDAFPPSQVIDTLGAGDTFNAALIHSLINKSELNSALRSSCMLAGHKCGQQGFANITQGLH